MTGPLLTTDRLILSPVAPADFDDLKTVWSNEDFTRHIMGRALTSEEIWFRLLRDLGHWQVRGHGNWSVRRREDEAYVGSVGVLDYHRDIEPPLVDPELGWGVAPAFQGQGLALEAVAAVLAWADQSLAAARTVCMIGPDNLASLKLAAKAGYRPFERAEYKASPVILLERPRGGPPPA